MNFKLSVAIPEARGPLESLHTSLDLAVQLVVAHVNARPEMLKGFDDLAVITDADDETVVIALFRQGNEFLLARETTDHRYADAMEALVHERYESDGDPYMVFARWDASL